LTDTCCPTAIVDAMVTSITHNTYFALMIVTFSIEQRCQLGGDSALA
jgi:hypothetical protein